MVHFILANPHKIYTSTPKKVSMALYLGLFQNKLIAQRKFPKEVDILDRVQGMCEIHMPNIAMRILFIIPHCVLYKDLLIHLRQIQAPVGCQ